MPAIARAKARGYRVSVTDFNPDAEGFAVADEHAVISTRDVEKTIAFAKNLHRLQPLHGVMTIASESAMTVAGVAEALGLPGTSPRSARLATNKVERQEAFTAAGISTPRFFRVSSAAQAISAGEELGWPVVVKPADSAGSRGVRKISSREEMASAVTEIRSISDCPEFLIEEFLTGSEHSIEGLVLDGTVYWTAFSDRNYDKKEICPPYFIEDGDTLPTSLATDVEEAARIEATKAVCALGITGGPVKGDILIDRRGPRIIEMAARLSGDYFCHETAPLHNGVDLLSATIDFSLGLTIAIDRLQPRLNQGVALRYYWPSPGIVKSIKGFEKARALPGVRFVKLEPRWRDLAIGSKITAPTSMGERMACVLASASTRAKAIDIAEQAVSMLRIDTE